MITKELIKTILFENKEQFKQKYIEREILKELINLIDIKEIIFIQGVRRSGKSTLMKLLAQYLIKKYPEENILYINFEDERLSNSSTEDLNKLYDLFLEINQVKERKFVLFDEIQNVEMWEKWIHRMYETNGKNIKFFITGSNASLTRSKYATVLTGRNLTLNVYPFSLKEFLNYKGLKPEVDLDHFYYLNKARIKQLLETYIKEGGFPEILKIKDEKIKRNLLQNYFSDIIYRDILFKHNIKDVYYFEGFVKYLLTNFTHSFSFNKIKNVFNYGINTIITYISYIQESFLIKNINFFSYSLKCQEKSNKKIYCIDNGLRNAVSFKFSKDEGKLVENLVFINLKRKDAEIYYWKKKGEVDFIIKNKDQSLTAINVSYTDEIKDRETKALLEFKKEFKKTKELILITKDTEKKEKGIKFIPLWKWLL